MSQSDAVFSGRIPEIYDQNLGDFMFEPFAADLAKRISITEGRLLEIAAGTGIVTLELASSLPAAVTIVASDLNPAMLEFAQTKSGMERVSWEQADALALPFPNAEFHVAVCQFGVMFFPDKVRGLSEIRRVLKPGGRLIFSVWGEISTTPVMKAVVDALAERNPKHPLWFLERTPCGYSDPSVIRRDVQAAGFGQCTIEKVTLTGHVSTADEPAIGLCQGSPLRAEIEAVDPEGVDVATKTVAASIRRRLGDNFDATLQALVITAPK